MGNFKNNGKEWRPEGTPEFVNIHDFMDRKLGRAVPYGVYDMSDNVGWVSVGTNHDTATFAVNAIRRWWQTMGRNRYPKAKRLMITADGGGSNGYRVRLWKIELQRFADEIKLPISVCHLPPGTSKWNKIEHRLFSFITIDWRGKPLRTFRTIVPLIAATTTDTGLKVRAEIDTRKYPRGVKVSDAEMAALNLYATHFMATGTTRSHLAPESLQEGELTDLLWTGPYHAAGTARARRRGDRMRRREFIAGLGSAAAWPLAAQAQQGERVRRIGMLWPTDENDPLMKARF